MAHNSDGVTVRPSDTPEFVGWSKVGTVHFFLLGDPSDKKNPVWLKLGERWNGFTIQSFNPLTEKLTLGKDGRETNLGLRHALLTPTSTFFPGLLKGTAAEMNGVVIYSPDAELNFGKGVISSPTGLMVSDPTQTFIGGDLQLVTDRTTLHVEDGMYNSSLGRLQGKHMTVKLGPPDQPLKDSRPATAPVSPPISR